MSLVLVDTRDGIATIALNRPEKLNALTAALCDELTAALRAAAHDTSVRAIVITGAGRGFCAGADLTILGTDDDALVRAGREIALLIRSAPQPVIAAVNGAAAGGGANLALAWATFPPLALRRAKEAIYKSLAATLPEMLDFEVVMQHELFATPEARARLQSLATRSR